MGLLDGYAGEQVRRDQRASFAERPRVRSLVRNAPQSGIPSVDGVVAVRDELPHE